jgi:ABC-type transporter Mla maintaining outer membrane lipid asymmetry ATPase subunit MlaF
MQLPNSILNFLPEGFRNAMFTLSLHGDESTQAQLKTGYSYCLVLHSDVQRKEVLEALSSQPGTAIVANNGGLISNLRVWENLTLPVQYHDIQAGGELEDNVVNLLEKCGLRDEQSVTTLLLKLPDQLSLFEKRLVGFVRAMLMAPEMIVYDSLHEGLSHKEMEKTARFDRIFRLHYPFRTSVLLSFEEYRDETEPRQIVIQL